MNATSTHLRKRLSCGPKASAGHCWLPCTSSQQTGILWNQVRDHISLRRVYVEDMRPKNLTGTSYVYFAAAKDILSGTRNIQLMEIADPRCSP